MGGCCGEGIPSCERVFDDRTARDDLRRLRRDGPPWATRELIAEVAAGVEPRELSVIDIGAGVGAVHLALVEMGARRAVDIDGSGAYLAVARDEAARRGLADRVEHVLGDATVVAASVEPAMVVTMDRVVCCYGDVEALLAAATSLAGHRIGLVYPKDRWWTRLAVTIANPVFFSRSGGYRMRVHRQATLDRLLAGAGFDRIAGRDGRLWRVETWERVRIA